MADRFGGFPVALGDTCYSRAYPANAGVDLPFVSRAIWINNMGVPFVVIMEGGETLEFAGAVLNMIPIRIRQVVSVDGESGSTVTGDIIALA